MIVNYCLDLKLSKEKINSLLSKRVLVESLEPRLVKATELTVSQNLFKRFTNLDKKNVFRKNLLTSFKQKLIELGLDEFEINKLIDDLLKLEKKLDDYGALIFGELVSEENFKRLIENYNSMLVQDGSKSWLHSYINLANYPNFLNSTEFNGAFLDPLLILLIAYRIGGPIRIVDARGKDAQPMSILAQDNMLHIDNTQFNDEFKIILTWEKNQPKGPKGQNFVFIPGTHKAVRDCSIGLDNKPFSTEKHSVFLTDESVQNVFKIQREFLSDEPLVVEVTHPDKPMTCVFSAGALVHHRYRNNEGLSRSCIIIAFHRSQDNPGEFLASDFLNLVSTDEKDLNNFLFGNAASEQKFIEAILTKTTNIIRTIQNLNDEKSGSELIDPEEMKLDKEAFEKWKNIVTKSSTVEELKIKKCLFNFENILNREELFELVCSMMWYDRHGPLYLILYGDNHEEIRKWARNKIREMKVDKMREYLSEWIHAIEQPNEQHLLKPNELNDIALQLTNYTKNCIKLNAKACLEPIEKISSMNAFRSVIQLMNDLGEAVLRCESRQMFLTTCTLLFWSSVILFRLMGKNDATVFELGKKLLMNYIASFILVKLQIDNE